jgi:hypothetical protein
MIGEYHWEEVSMTARLKITTYIKISIK